jgi:hypothetical protein
MRNLNEPLDDGNDDIDNIIDEYKEDPSPRNEGEVIRFEPRAGGTTERDNQPLISKQDIEDFRSRWSALQASFVDEPRKAVEEADKLVSSAINSIAGAFHEQHSNLEKQWSKGSEVSTEDLRVSLRHYRAFFDRLLSI